MSAPEILHDDWRLTAYALGETDALEDADRGAVEALLASDPAARAVVEEVRASASALAADLAGEAPPRLAPEQRAAILMAASRGNAPTPARAAWRSWLPFGAAAAALLVVGAVGLGSEAPVRTRRIVDFEVEIAQASNVARPIYDDGTVGEPLAAGETARILLELSRQGGPGLPPGPALNPSAGAYFNDGGDGDFRGRTESILRRAVTRELNSARAPDGPQGFLLFAGDSDNGANMLAPGVRLAGSAGAGLLSRADRSQGAGMLGQGKAAPQDDEFFGALLRPGSGPVGIRPQPATEGTAHDSGVYFDDGLREAWVQHGPQASEAYDAIVENDFLRVTDHPLSTFSIDVDTASYSNVRRMLNGGALPPPGAVRTEEFVNYFPYAYEPPTGPHPFAVHLEVAQCPWRLEHRLVRIGLKGREVPKADRPAGNLVFLIDVSGSMQDPAKLPLVKTSLKLLLDELTPRDKVAIVVYAGESGLVLAPTSCERKAEIAAAIDALTPGGSTNGAGGITLAYEVAAQGFVAGGTNRVILCTDGDFNVGVTSQDELVRLIEEKAKEKVFLSVFGFGMGNLKDSTLEKLADRGNGNYGYVDDEKEARKALVEQAGGTLVTIAKDVKVQVEFNPAQVSAYRLVGYENRVLAAQDFNDDRKDAGEIGAGHTVTALYEVVPAGRTVETPSIDPLKYQTGSRLTEGAASGETLTVKLRYKQPEGDVSTPVETALRDFGVAYERASPDFKFAASVAQFALLLRRSAHRGTATWEAVVESANEAVGDDPGGYRREFVTLVEKARSLAPAK